MLIVATLIYLLSLVAFLTYLLNVDWHFEFENSDIILIAFH